MPLGQGSPLQRRRLSQSDQSQLLLSRRVMQMSLQAPVATVVVMLSAHTFASPARNRSTSIYRRRINEKMLPEPLQSGNQNPTLSKRQSSQSRHLVYKKPSSTPIHPQLRHTTSCSANQSNLVIFLNLKHTQSTVSYPDHHLHSRSPSNHAKSSTSFSFLSPPSPGSACFTNGENDEGRGRRGGRGR